VVDALGELAPVNFAVAVTPARRGGAVMLRDAVVLIGTGADGTDELQRIQLATGAREVLHHGAGELTVLGDGAAVLFVQDGVAWLIEDGREEEVARRVSRVITAPSLTPPLPPRAPTRQDDLAMLLSAGDAGHTTLAVLDVRTRRLATVTDDVFGTTGPDTGFDFDDGCGQPWTTRTGGAVFEGLSQDPRYLFFVELGQAPSLWLLPIDLSAPPRRLATLADPARCHAPLASPDGGRVGFAEDGADGGARVTLSR
jgi:hypothetical protein